MLNKFFQLVDWIKGNKFKSIVALALFLLAFLFASCSLTRPLAQDISVEADSLNMSIKANRVDVKFRKQTARLYEPTKN